MGQFFLSAKPFNCGLFGGAFVILIPCNLQYASNGPRYSPPLPAQTHFNAWPGSRSTLAWNSLNALNASSFDLSKDTKISLNSHK